MASKKKRVGIEPPRLVAKTELRMVRWLQLVVDWENRVPSATGAKVKMSTIIRRAVLCELERVHDAGGPDMPE